MHDVFLARNFFMRTTFLSERYKKPGAHSYNLVHARQISVCNARGNTVNVFEQM